MKTFQRNVLFALALLLTFSMNLNAQKKTETKTKSGTYIIIQKNNEEEKVVHNFDELGNVIFDFDSDNIDIQVKEDFMRGRHHSPKPYLGVYTSRNHNGSGIVIDKVVRNSAAEKAGLQKGDIITSVNGNKIVSVAGLRGELRKHKVGDPVDIQITRNGQTSQVEATLRRKQRQSSYTYHYDYSQKVERDPCKVFIGVYNTTHRSDKGVRVTGVIENTPAFEVDLIKGDYITAIDGIKVQSHTELLAERNKHNPGDKFLISYTRSGVAYEVMAQFKSCDENQKEETITEQAPEVQTVPQITQPTNNTLQLEGLEAYPNPTYGDLNLNFKAEAKPTTIRIVDVQGRVVFNEALNNFDGNYNRTIDLSNGTPGVLVVTITQEGKIFTKNIILLARA